MRILDGDAEVKVDFKFVVAVVIPKTEVSKQHIISDVLNGNK